MIATTTKNGKFARIVGEFNVETGDYGFELSTNVGGLHSIKTQDFSTVAEMYRNLSEKIEAGKEVA